MCAAARRNDQYMVRTPALICVGECAMHYKHPCVHTKLQARTEKTAGDLDQSNVSATTRNVIILASSSSCVPKVRSEGGERKARERKAQERSRSQGTHESKRPCRERENKTERHKHNPSLLFLPPSLPSPAHHKCKYQDKGCSRPILRQQPSLHWTRTVENEATKELIEDGLLDAVPAWRRHAPLPAPSPSNSYGSGRRSLVGKHLLRVCKISLVCSSITVFY